MSFIKDLFSSKEESQKKNPSNTLMMWMSDEEVLSVVKKWKESQTKDFMRAIDIDGERNKQYYSNKAAYDLDYQVLGNNISGENRIFSSIKTVNPYITSKPAEPVVYPKKITKDKEKEEESKRLSELTQAILEKTYKDQQMQMKNEQMSLNRYFFKIGIIAYGIEDGKIVTRNVEPKNCIFDVTAKSFNTQRYFGEKIKISVDELIERFPDKQEQILEKNSSRSDGYRLEAIEWYTNDVHCVTMGTDVVLLLEVNPLINPDEGKFKYYDKAPIPYEPMNVYNDGSQIIDLTGEIDQSYRLQDSAYQIFRMIMDNVRYVANPLTVATWNINEKQLSEIKLALPGAWVLLPKDSDLKYLQAAPLPVFVSEQYQRTLNAIDSIFGTPATFRWDSDTTAQSWVSKEVLRQQAAGALAPLSRAIERTMDRIYKWWLHLILCFIDDDEFFQNQIVSVLWEEVAMEYRTLLTNNFGDGIEVEVVAWSLLPDDKIYQAEQAKELYLNWKIATDTAFERMGIKNPQEEADKLALEATVNQLKAQELERRASQEQKSAEFANQELGNINQEIGNMENWSPEEQINSMIESLG